MANPPYIQGNVPLTCLPPRTVKKTPLLCDCTALPVSPTVLFQHIDSSTDCELLEDRDGLLDVTLGPMFVTEFVGCKTQVCP